MFLAFDWFNTLGDILNFASRAEREEYGRQIDQNTLLSEVGGYEPFNLAERWCEMPVFDDVAKGLERLSLNHRIAIFSNAPVVLMGQMLVNNLISEPVECIIPLEEYRVAKPQAEAYEALKLYARDQYGYTSNQVMVVTANETFGDIKGAKAQGMRAALIRGDSNLKTLHDLADWLDQRRTSLERS